jgi:hypothetical protein
MKYNHKRKLAFFVVMVKQKKSIWWMPRLEKDDEGRSSLRKASRRWQATFDPGMSKWGNPFRLKIGIPLSESIGEKG